jgi:hypothetical protein
LSQSSLEERSNFLANAAWSLWLPSSTASVASPAFTGYAVAQDWMHSNPFRVGLYRVRHFGSQTGHKRGREGEGRERGGRRA